MKKILLATGLLLTVSMAAQAQSPCPSTQSMQQLLTQIQAGQFAYTNDPKGYVGYHIKKQELIAAGVPSDITNAEILKNNGKVILQVLRKNTSDNVKERAPGYSLANDPGLYETIHIDDTTIPACDYSYDLNGAPNGTAFLIVANN